MPADAWVFPSLSRREATDPAEPAARPGSGSIIPNRPDRSGHRVDRVASGVLSSDVLSPVFSLDLVAGRVRGDPRVDPAIPPPGRAHAHPPRPPRGAADLDQG